MVAACEPPEAGAVESVVEESPSNLLMSMFPPPLRRDAADFDLSPGELLVPGGLVLLSPPLAEDGLLEGADELDAAGARAGAGGELGAEAGAGGGDEPDAGAGDDGELGSDGARVPDGLSPGF